MKSPFKFLDPYQKEDKNVYFGRQREIELLYRTTFKTGLILVYGVTGTGKTSLILCGLANRFRDSDWYDIYIRRGDNINSSLQATVKSRAVTAIPDDFTIHQGMDSLYLDFLKPIYLIFDQFEELFISGSKEEQETFFKTIAHLLEENLPIKIILVMREEYIARLNNFESYVPRLFDFRLRVETMKLSSIQEVIKNSCDSYGIRIKMPETTIDSMIKKNVDPMGVVQLPYLQVYMDYMYKRAYVQKGKYVAFTPALVEEIGKIDNVITYFLDEQITQIQRLISIQYPDAPENTVWEVLNKFASAEGTGLPVSVNKLVRQLSLEAKTINFSLIKLQAARILRPSPKEETFEFAHDTLAQRINDKRSGDEKALLLVERTVKDRFTLYNDTHSLLTEEDLNYINRYKEKIEAKLDNQHIKFMKKSQDYVDKRKRIKTVTTTAIIVILLLFATVAGLKWIESDKNYKIAKANNLASQAQLMITQDPTTAIRLAEAAWYLGQNLQVVRTIHQIYTNNAFYKTSVSHQKEIYSAVFSPDNTKIVTASEDQTARLWDLSGKQLAKFPHSNRLYSAVFSPDGTRILTASRDHTARVWSLQGKMILELAHNDSVYSAKFSPDGTKIITVSGEYSAKIWNLQKELIAELRHNQSVGGALFSPDGNRVLTISNNRAILWDIQGNVTAKFKHKKHVRFAGFSPDSRKVVTASADGTAGIWDLGGKELAILEHPQKVDSAQFSPDGSKILTASADYSARLWDLEENKLAEFKHNSQLFLPGFSPDGTKIVTSSKDQTARLWDLKGKELAKCKHRNSVYSARFSHDGTKLVTASVDNTAKIWDVRAMGKLEFKSKQWVEYAEFSPDGEHIVALCGDNSVRLLNINGHETARIIHDNTIHSVRFSPDGKRILTASRDGTARVWDLQAKEMSKLKHKYSVNFAQFFSADRIVTISDDRLLKVWNKKGQVVTQFENDEALDSPHLSNNGAMILAISGKKTIKIWNLKGNEILRIQDRNYNDIYSARFSPDGKTILVSTMDRVVSLWNLHGHELQRFKYHLTVYSAKFAVGGKKILITSEDNTARLWDLHGQELTAYTHDQPINSSEFSVDGKKIITTSHDQIIRIWNTPKGIIQWLKTADIPKLTGEQKKKYGIEE